MKRIISLLLVILSVFGFSACKKSEITPKIRGISFTADITYYNENYKGDCSIDADGTMKLTVTEPEGLSGYTVTLSSEGITAEYLGISFTPTAGSMPFSSVAETVFKTLGSISPDTPAEKSGETITVSGGSGIESYTLYISPSGLPQSLMIPDERFSVYFYNVALI